MHEAPKEAAPSHENGMKLLSVDTQTSHQMVKAVLTEGRRNDELDVKRAEQPYVLYVLQDGRLVQCKPHDPVPDSTLMRFDVDEDVFPPDFGMTTKLLTRTACAHYDNAECVLEMGAGTGFPGISYAAHSKNLRELMLADIHLPAVSCAQKNVAYNRRLMPAGCRVSVFQSDLFSGVPMDREFDLIIHNQTFYPDNGRFGLHRDGGEEITHRFLYEAFRFLEQKGVILMNFASFVDARHDPRHIAEELGYRVSVVGEEQSRDGVTGFVYEIKQ